LDLLVVDLLVPYKALADLNTGEVGTSLAAQCGPKDRTLVVDDPEDKVFLVSSNTATYPAPLSTWTISGGSSTYCKSSSKMRLVFTCL
jgi:hypothetical protein